MRIKPSLLAGFFLAALALFIPQNTANAAINPDGSYTVETPTTETCFKTDTINGKYTIVGFQNETVESLVIPNYIQGHLVEAIGDGAFKNTGVKEVTIQNDLASIGKESFANTANFLTFTIAPGATVETMDESAFSCSGIHQAFVYGSLKTMGDSAFSQTATLTDFLVQPGGNIEHVGNKAFYDSGVHNVTLQGNVQSIGDYAFANCGNILNLTVSSQTPYTLGAYALQNAGIQEVNLGAGLATIETGTFEGCANLENVSLPDSLTHIGSNAFAGDSNIKSLTVSDNVTADTSAFSGVGGSTLQAIAATNNATIKQITGVTDATPANNNTSGVTDSGSYATPAPIPDKIGKCKLKKIKKLKKGKQIRLTWTKASGATLYEVYSRVIKKGMKKKKIKKLLFKKRMRIEDTSVVLKIKRKTKTTYFIRPCYPLNIGYKYGKASNKRTYVRK